MLVKLKKENNNNNSNNSRIIKKKKSINFRTSHTSILIVKNIF